MSGYLRDFLFRPEQLRTPASALSGGERNRLLLARLFARPANLLVLDEPTNDLDIDTLDLLEELVARFLRHAAAGQPRPRLPRPRGHEPAGARGRRSRAEFVGGYSDWAAAYAEVMLEVLNAAAGLRNRAPDRRFVPRNPGRILTRFERRGERLGHAVHDLCFEKV
jgi:ATP-binding cassette subfamily F protein uup